MFLTSYPFKANKKYFFNKVATVLLFLVFVGTVQAQQGRPLSEAEFIQLAAQMTANCKAKYLATTKKLTIEQIEWICGCISIRTLKSVSAQDIVTEYAANQTEQINLNTNFRRALSHYGEVCVKEAVSRFKLN